MATDTPIRIANPAPPTTHEHFRGRVALTTTITEQRPGGICVKTVLFEPMARTDWHAHPGEQLLYIVAGNGRVGRKGMPTIEVEPGDLVFIEPDQQHWHGAGPQSYMIHLAITTGGTTSWGEPHAVSEEEYSGIGD